VTASYSGLKKALRFGPVAVTFAVGQNFYYYSTGIFSATSSTSCGTSINHAMIAVGYGLTTDGQEYVTVRNSWGTSWGELGYIRVALKDTTDGGVCQIYNYDY